MAPENNYEAFGYENQYQNPYQHSYIEQMGPTDDPQIEEYETFDTGALGAIVTAEAVQTSTAQV